MTGDPDGPSEGGIRSRPRRGLLATVGTGLAGSLAGCGLLDSGPNGVTLETSSCPAGTTADSPLERRLLPVSRAEYSESTLWYTAADPSLARRYPSFDVYLQPAELTARNLGLSLSNVTRSYTLRPPVAGFPAYLALETPLDTEIIRLNVETEHYFGHVESDGDYEVYESRTPAVKRFVLADGRAIVAPGRATGDLSLSSRKRIDRLLALERGERAPYTCFHPSLGTLLERVEETTLVNVVFRPDDGTFGDDPAHVPAGAAAGAYAVTVDAPPDYFEEERDDGYEVHLEYTALFPEAEVDEAATLEHVRDHRSRTRTSGDGPSIGFEEPAVERSGRTVTARETITLE